MNFKVIFILAYFLIFLNNARSEICEATGTTIYYGNGIFNNREDAVSSLNALSKMNLNELDPEGRVELKNAFNLNPSVIESLLTVALEKIDNNYRTFWTAILGLEKPPEWYLQLMNDTSVWAQTAAYFNVEEMIAQYTADIQQHRRIFVVAHSQGNFFAESAITQSVWATHSSQLESPEIYSLGLGGVSVATPAFSRLNFPVVTFADDSVINFVRAALGAPAATLPMIGAGLPPKRDPLGHSFSLAYLGTPESRAMIKSDLIELSKKVKYPNANVSAIKVDMNASDAGFALVVTDPHGERKFPRIRFPKRGFQNDHFETMCSTVEEGTYQFKIDKSSVQSSSCPCEVSIDIEAGDQKKNFTVTAASSVTNSNGKNELVFNVDAVKNKNGSLSFKIKD